MTIADGIAAMERVADRTLDESFTTALTGSSRDFAESALYDPAYQRRFRGRGD